MKRLLPLLLAPLLLLGRTTVAVGQSSDPNLVQPVGPQDFLPLDPGHFNLALVVLGFGLIVLALEVWLLIRARLEAALMVKIIIITLIIIATLFLIAAGHSNNQIAPAMGLLGTIAGYLLGRGENKKPTE